MGITVNMPHTRQQPVNGCDRRDCSARELLAAGYYAMDCFRSVIPPRLFDLPADLHELSS